MPIQRTDPLTRRASMQYYRYPTTYNCKSYSTYTFYAPAYFIQMYIYIYLVEGMYKTIIDCFQSSDSYLSDDGIIQRSTCLFLTLESTMSVIEKVS